MAFPPDFCRVLGDNTGPFLGASCIEWLFFFVHAETPAIRKTAVSSDLNCVVKAKPPAHKRNGRVLLSFVVAGHGDYFSTKK